MGLRIMHYRATMIGASLSIERLESGGTRVTCTLPAPA
jgi:nitrate/nitrite-specific signal transduction histidine kinase